ncbi:MAG: hypothetical protein R3346_04565 [Candidatus Spechtbacterales bacterium]|nr:hypothetical protein [Candidatus Spechtbacterales bacterium]
MLKEVLQVILLWTIVVVSLALLVSYLRRGIDNYVEKLKKRENKIAIYGDAYSVLREDLITPQEVEEKTGLKYAPDQLASLLASLPDLDTLEWLHKNDFSIVAGPPEKMNLRGIYNLKPNNRYFHPWEGLETSRALDCKDSVNPGWLIISKKLTSETYEHGNVPNIAEYVWFLNMYQRVRGKTLLAPFERAITSSKYSIKSRLYRKKYGFIGCYFTHKEKLILIRLGQAQKEDIPPWAHLTTSKPNL